MYTMTCKWYSGIYTSLLTTLGDLKQARPVTQMYYRKASIIETCFKLHIQRHRTKVGLKDITE